MKTCLMFIASAIVFGGCASSQATQQPTEQQAARPASGQQPMQPGMMRGEMAGACPMAVEATTVRAEDVEGGTALVFTTTGDVAELRRRVARMAELHNRDDAAAMRGMQGPRGRSRMRGGMMDGGTMASAQGDGGATSGMGRYGMHGGMMQGRVMMPPSTGRSEYIEGGARLVLTARDPAEASTLRESVRQMAEHMASGQCPMMEHTGGQQGAE